MDEPTTYKPLIWIGSTRETVRSFPVEVRRAVGFALRQAQGGGKHVNAKPLKGFGGAGVLEVVENHRGNTFRSVYTVKFADAVFVLDAFQKKSKSGIATPKHVIDRIKERLKQAEKLYAEWRAAKEGESNGEEDRT